MRKERPDRASSLSAIQDLLNSVVPDPRNFQSRSARTKSSRRSSSSPSRSQLPNINIQGNNNLVCILPGNDETSKVTELVSVFRHALEQRRETDPV